MVICLERGADLHMAQLMPLPLTVSCFSKVQTGFTFLVPAHPDSPGQRAVKCVCVIEQICYCFRCACRDVDQESRRASRFGPSLSVTSDGRSRRSTINKSTTSSTLSRRQTLANAAAGSLRSRDIRVNISIYQRLYILPISWHCRGNSWQCLQCFDAVGWATGRASGL